MKIKDNLLILNEDDLKDIINLYAQKENIKIIDLNFIDDDILIKGIIKKIFSLEFTCRIYIENVGDEKIAITIKDIKALKVNLFSVIESINKKNYVKSRLGTSIKIEGNKIYIDLNILSEKISGLNLKLKNLKVRNESLLIEFINLDISLKKSFESKIKILGGI